MDYYKFSELQKLSIDLHIVFLIKYILTILAKEHMIKLSPDKIMNSQLDPNLSNSRAAMNNLALLYHNQGKYDKAEPLLEQCYEMMKSKIRPDHPDTMTAMNNLAVLHYKQGRYDKAGPRYIHCYEMISQCT